MALLGYNQQCAVFSEPVGDGAGAARPRTGRSGLLSWYAPLTDGTEVAIACSNGDIDLPYIAYALHDSKHPDLVNWDNHTRNILRTPANNKLRMEDKRGEEHINLATEYGKQLNSGHLVDAQGQRRGQGVELRTDEHGVIRAGKGLFVSAKAQGEALDMDAALKADVDSQIQMSEQRLKPLNEALLMSTPAGMALTIDEHLQMAVSKTSPSILAGISAQASWVI